MEILNTSLPDVLIIKPDVFEDMRGCFLETYHRKKYEELGLSGVFVQDNLSFSTKGVLRGLHYQEPDSQAKLVQVIKGEIFDVAVDIRRGSPHFGRWTGANLSDENRLQLLVPEGFAHGFCVVSDIAYVAYKCTDFYSPKSEGGILWSDPDIGIEWPVESPNLSEKDGRYPLLRDIPLDRLPPYAEK